MSYEFKTAWRLTRKAEGGYSNRPPDPETNHGITVNIARAYGFTGDMRDLTPELAEDIAKKEYWDWYKLDSIAMLSPPIAFEVFDTCFNMWAGSGVKFLQRALNALNLKGEMYPDISADGIMGQQTLSALRTFLQKRREGEAVLLACLNAQQCSDYIRQCAETVGKEDFFYGWVLNRVKL